MPRAAVLVALLAVGAITLAACSSRSNDAADASAATTATTVPPADVTVTGPITGGTRGVMSTPMGPGQAEQFGYTEDEYFVAGNAPSYTPTAPLTEDGEWTVTPGPEAPYVTRIVVRHPVDAADFNGTVVVEWLNTTAERESDVEWGALHPMLMREGYAYVSVSAQQIGVMGGEGRLEVPGAEPDFLLAAKDWDPVRYAPLNHPGDTWSYGIYTDVADLLRAPGAIDPLGGLQPERIIAVGQSQSASRLVTYANAVQPVTRAFDGFLIHSRGGSSSPLSDDPAAKPPANVAVRTDLGAPVLVFQSETELTRGSSPGARQPDTETVRVWETAGTAHADQNSIDAATVGGRRWTNGSYDPTPTCGKINTGPSTPLVRAAMSSLNDWVTDGTLPPTAPRLEVVDGVLVRDQYGNAVGGVRSPAVDAPVSTLTGAGNPVSVFCILFGQTTPFDQATLVALYGDNATYVAKVTASADDALKKGFLLQAERDELVADAKTSGVPTP